MKLFFLISDYDFFFAGIICLGIRKLTRFIQRENSTNLTRLMKSSRGERTEFEIIFKKSYFQSGDEGVGDLMGVAVGEFFEL